MTRKHRKQALQTLENELNNKLRLVQRLEKENQLLQLKQFLLAAFCDSLGQLRQQAALSNAVVSASELLLLEQLAQQPSNKSNAYISRGSLQARQQIGTTPSTHPSADALHAQAKSASSACSSNSGTSDTPDELHGEDETDRDAGEAAADWDDEGSIPAAPAGDPLHLMKLCLSLAEDSSAESPTLRELLAAAGQMARDMSYHLHQYELGAYKAAFAPDDPARPQPIQQTRAAFLQYYSLWCRAVLTMQGDLATDVTLTSYDGSGLITQEHNGALYNSFVRRLGLKPDQLQYLAQGITVFRDLRAPVLEATGQLQQEIAVQESCSSSEPETAAAAADSTGSSASDISCQQLSTTKDLASMHNSLFQHLGRNNRQEERLARMRVLLGKDLILRAALGGFVFGAMTWPQIAKAVVGASPFTLGAMPLSVAILELNDEVQGQK